ncbi:MAG: ABC transporter substrate-binding protein [Parvibaculaceae bacterium]
MRLNRRDFVAASAATMALPMAGAFATEPPKPESIVVNNSGGAVGVALRKAFYDVFEKETGIRIVESSPMDFAKLRAMVESGNIEWALTEIDPEAVGLARRLNLLEPIDDSIVNRSTYPEQYKAKDIFTDAVGAVILGYRTDVFKEGAHPKGWVDFWDVAKFPGPRALRNHPSGNIEFALIADGVPMDKLYPLDLDRAFKKLDEIKKNISVWWESGAQAVQLILDKEVVLVTTWNGRFTDVLRKDPNAPVAIEWTQAMAIDGTYAIPKGAKDAYWAQRLLAVMADPERQAIYAAEIPYPSPNPEMLKHLDPALLDSMPSAPQNMSKMFRSNYEWWDEHAATTLERWNAWILT